MVIPFFIKWAYKGQKSFDFGTGNLPLKLETKLVHRKTGEVYRQGYHVSNKLDSLTKSKGHIDFTPDGKVEFWQHDNGDVYRSPTSNVIEHGTGYRSGRYECAARDLPRVKTLIKNWKMS